MGIFQKAYNWLDSWRTPRWLKELFAEVELIIAQTAYGLAKEYIAKIEAKIIEVNGLPIGNKDKFEAVCYYARDLGVALSQTGLNVLINALILRLKERKAI